MRLLSSDARHPVRMPGGAPRRPAGLPPAAGHRPKWLAAIVLIGVLGLGIGRALPEPPPGRAAMLISQNIRPYIEAAEGAIQALEGGGLKVETFRVDKLTAAETDGLVASIRREAYDLVLTVGPEASSLAWTKAGEGACPIVYTMVLDPERLAGAPKAPCGISLGIPIDVQLRAISRTLPSVRQIGLMFDPGNNTAFYDAAERLSAQPGLAVIPLRVSSRKEIGRVLAAHWPRIDGVWLIPDRTIISESIVQYIIKQALLNDTPVVGYNRFFYESGAAISFVLDYAEIGAQAGRLALEAAERRECGNESPVFQTWINTRVLDKLGIPSGNDGGTVILK